MDLLPHTQNCGLRMRDARAVMHVGIADPRGKRGGENVPGFPGTCARNFTYLARGPWHNQGWCIGTYGRNIRCNKRITHLFLWCLLSVVIPSCVSYKASAGKGGACYGEYFNKWTLRCHPELWLYLCRLPGLIWCERNNIHIRPW